MRVLFFATVLAAVLAGPGVASAQAPPGYTSCPSKKAASSELANAGGYDAIGEADPFGGGPPDVPLDELFLVEQVFCRDLDGDGQRELVVLLGCCTVSSPTPWAILKRGAGGQPGLAFLVADASYVRKLTVVTYKGRPVVQERRSILTRSDANCCPTGDPLIRQIGISPGGTFGVLRSFRVRFRGYRPCGSLGRRWANLRIRDGSCRTARSVVRGWARFQRPTTRFRRIGQPRGWRCRNLYKPLRFQCKRSGSKKFVKFDPGELY